MALRLEQPTHQPAFSYGSSTGFGAKDVTERCAGKILLPSHCSCREENHITSLLCRVQESCGEVYNSARAVGYVPALCTHRDAFLPPAFVNRGAETEVRSPMPEPHSVSGPSPFKAKALKCQWLHPVTLPTACPDLDHPESTGRGLLVLSDLLTWSPAGHSESKTRLTRNTLQLQKKKKKKPITVGLTT